MADKKEKEKKHGYNCSCEACSEVGAGNENEDENGESWDEEEGGEKMANPIQVEKFLKGMDYPVSKQDIIEKAEEEGADDLVMETLNKLPEKQYSSPVSISKELGKIE